MVVAGWLAVVLACVGGPPAAGEEVSLSDYRFTEIGYGVSVRPPVGAEPVAVPSNGAVAAWTLGEEFTLQLRIARSREAFDDIAQVIGQAWAGSWVGLAQAAPKFVQTEGTTFDGRVGLIQVAELEREPPALLNLQQRQHWDADPLFYGQAAVKLDPYTLAIVEVFAPQSQARRAEAVLRASAGSMQLMKVEDLYALRREQIEAGQAFLADLDRRRAFEAAEPEAWFLVERHGVPAGYEYRRVQTDPAVVRKLKFALRDPGVAVGVQTVVRFDRVQVSHWREAYAENKGRLETWSLVTELSARPEEGPRVFAHEPKVARWTETGLRDDRLITLAYQDPPDEDVVREVRRAERFRGEFVEADVLYRRAEKQWEIPDMLPPGLLDDDRPIPPTQLYVGQAELVLVPSLLPHDRERVLAFYAYDSETSSLSLRTYEVEPLDDGGWWVRERATPGSPPVRYRHDRGGRLQEVVHPNGLRSVRTTREQLAFEWPELRRAQAR